MPRLAARPDRVIVAYQQWDTISGNVVHPMALQVDYYGNVIEEDTIGIPVALPANGYYEYSYVDQIIPLPNTRYLISGSNLFTLNENNAAYYRFYLADSSLRPIDTFLFKRRDFGRHPQESGGEFLNTPDMVMLPTGNVIAGGMFDYLDFTLPGQPYYVHCAGKTECCQKTYY